MKETKKILAAALAAAALALAGCGGGGGSVGAGGAITDPAAMRYDNAVTLEPLAGGTMSAAVGVNAGGTVVGLSGTSTAEVRAVKWTISQAGAASAAVELPPLPGNGYASAYGVNDAGLAAGESGEGGDAAIVAVVWRPGASAAAKLAPLGAGNGAAFSVNASGRIVGEATGAGDRPVPVHWANDNAAAAALPLLAGGASGSAYGISDDNTIVGESENASGAVRAVRWKIDAGTGVAGSPEELPPLPGHVRSVATGVSKAGKIVGESESASGEIHAVRWEDGSLLGIPTGIETTDLGAAGVNSSAVAINDDGRIAGWHEDSGGSPLGALWHALSAPKAARNTDFAGSGRGMGINRGGLVVGVRGDKGFASSPR